MSMMNRQFVLADRPVGMPTEATFKMVETPLPDLKDGEVLVKALYLSVDPYMRGRISGMKSYAAPVEVGGLMVGGGVARVIESKNPKFNVGDVVEIYMGWQEHAISDGKGLRKLDQALTNAAPPVIWMNIQLIDEIPVHSHESDGVVIHLNHPKLILFQDMILEIVLVFVEEVPFHHLKLRDGFLS